jgi:hypothetical protein
LIEKSLPFLFGISLTAAAAQYHHAPKFICLQIFGRVCAAAVVFPFRPNSEFLNFAVSVSVSYSIYIFRLHTCILAECKNQHKSKIEDGSEI